LSIKEGQLCTAAGGVKTSTRGVLRKAGPQTVGGEKREKKVSSLDPDEPDDFQE